jgi:hypothetical protein
MLGACNQQDRDREFGPINDTVHGWIASDNVNQSSDTYQQNYFDGYWSAQLAPLALDPEDGVAALDGSLDTGSPFATGLKAASGESDNSASLLSGSGPVPGVIEVSGRAKSAAAFLNYFPKGGGVEYVFDPETNTLATGKPASYLKLVGSPHQQLSRAIGANESTVLGGTMQHMPDGTFGFTENSGHYGERWTPELRNQFEQFLADNGIQQYQYTPWGG